MSGQPPVHRRSPERGVTCSHCNREWDGNAQCNCYQGMYMSEPSLEGGAEDEDEVKEEVLHLTAEDILKIKHLGNIEIVYKLILDKCSNSSELHLVLEYLGELKMIL